MIDRLIDWSVRQRILVVCLALLAATVGVWSALRLPMDAVPDITGVQVQVNTEVPALAPEEVEKLVTFPLETALAGTPGATELRSLSKFGLSQLTLQFTDGTDIYRARQLVSERLQSAGESLPPGLTPRLAPVSTGLGEVFHYTVDYPSDASNKPATRREQLMELKLVQERILKPQLRAVPGIAEINTAGGYDRQIVIAPRLDALRDAGLTVEDLAEIIARDVDNAGGGLVTQGDKQLIVRSVGRVQSAAEIATLPLKFAAGVNPLLVRDVADVGIGTRVRTGAATVDGDEAVIGVAMMLSGENSRTVAHRVAEKLASLQSQLPAGIVVRPLFNRSDLVNATIGTVEKNLFEGAVLVVAVLLALLGHWRAALIVAAAIPLAFLCALAGMARFGISGNLMSLGAIDFGLIIDGAVVIVENVVRRLAEKQHRLHRRLTLDERAATVADAARQVASPMFFGVLIITVVYVPILALTGVEGKMFHPMALTVMLALGAALVLALTLMPALCTMLLGSNIREGGHGAMSLARRAYAPVLQFALRRWPWIGGGALALFAMAAFVFGRLGAEFVPTLDEGTLVVQFNRAPSISLVASLEQQARAEQVLRREFPEIIRTFASIGTPEVATDPMGVNQADTYLLLRPHREWRRENGRLIDKAQLAELMKTALERELPEQELLFSQPIEMRFNELLEGIRADLAVKIYGDDFDVTEQLAAEIKTLLEKIPGGGEIEFETLGRTPLLEVAVRREALARHNAHAAEINHAVATALGGTTVGALIEGNRRTDLVVRLPDAARDDPATLPSLPVRVGEHGLVPLSVLAELRKVETVSPILRDGGRRRSALLVNLDTSDTEGWVRAAREKVAAAIKLPPGVTLEFGGQYENLIEAKARLALVVPAALAAIFVLIVLAFGRLRQALLIYTGIPLALTGGVTALWLRGMPFSITAAVGFIALSGVAVLNGLVLVSCFNQLRAEGRSVRDATIEGAQLRLRPVLMTALVAALGFIPMAFATGPGAEVQRPLATVVIGGIVSSTLLTLVVLPALYARLERERT